MVWLGGNLAKLLGTVTALLTVTAGVPRCECICPDGPMKPFCAGPSNAGSCGLTRHDAINDQGRHRVMGKYCPNCSGVLSASDPQAGPSREQVIKPSGCQQAIVTDTPPYAVEDLADGDERETAGPVAKLIPVTPARSGSSSVLGLQFPSRPTNRVILLCHFTC